MVNRATETQPCAPANLLICPGATRITEKLKSVVLQPRSGPLTQGTIFRCGVAEEYAGCSTHGVVITARCDAANDKVRVYNYLPVVRLDDWLHRDGRIIIADRLTAETLGQLRNTLRETNYSVSILESESPRSVLTTLFPASDKKSAKARCKFEELCRRYELAERGILSAPGDSVCLRMAEVAPKLKDAVLTELVHQRLAGYYFLDRVEPDGEDTGHVVLLREIQAMPRAVAEWVSEGIDAKQFAEICKTLPRVRACLRVGPDDLAMAVGVVRSPNLEHLMQSFSMLFGRIGIADPDPGYVSGLWTRQPSVEGG